MTKGITPTGVGFTGTRRGQTSEQRATLRPLLVYLFKKYSSVLRHGDCVDSDAHAHRIARKLGAFIDVHPPSDPKYRAWCRGDKVRPERPYIERNHIIVNTTRVLVATPEGPEQLRSGTWATIRYGMQLGRPVFIIWPDGSLEKRHNGEVVFIDAEDLRERFS